MNKSYIEWIDYYENATKEDVIQDMMLDINSIKEKDKEIERLHNIIKEVREYIEKELSGYAPRDFRDLVDGYSVLEILEKENK